MRIVFSLRHAGALRNYASTIGELAARGHELHLVFMTREKTPDGRLLAELTGRYPQISHEDAGTETTWREWRPLARAIRTTQDYVRYLEPEFAAAAPLRDRAARRVPPEFRRFVQSRVCRTRAGARLAAGLLRIAERALPTDPALVSFLENQRPDVVLVTPLVEFGSDQVEYIKAARALGIPAGVCVHSWDNLTTKGLLRGEPDRVYVWNERQKHEAVTMHGIEPSRVVVTGAPVYDQWFDRRPGTSREAFCAKVGLPVDRPFFLYLCSSQFVASGEAAFVRDWVQAVRSAPDERVRTAGILVRPHPRSAPGDWSWIDSQALPDTVLWPKGGDNPVDDQSKRDYFDSMYHSAAAVGINTSAQIEAAIVGRPVYTIEVPDEVGAQRTTLHFHYLLTEYGGFLHTASSLDDHVRALAGALDDTAATAAQLRTFVAAFVRPHGLTAAATPRLADAVEELARTGRRAATLPPWLRVVQRALHPMAIAMSRSRQEPNARAAHGAVRT